MVFDDKCALTTKKLVLTHAYVHRLADVHLAGFAPAFTLSLCDSEYARKPPVPIAPIRYSEIIIGSSGVFSPHSGQ